MPSFILKQTFCGKLNVVTMPLQVNAVYTTGVQGNPDEDALFTELFYTRHYNRLTRPVIDLSQTTHVQLGLVLQKIVQVVRNSISYALLPYERKIKWC